MKLPTNSPFAASRLYHRSWGVDFDEVFETKSFGGHNWTVLDFHPEVFGADQSPQYILIRDEYKIALSILQAWHWDGTLGPSLNAKYGATGFVSIPYCGNSQPAPLRSSDLDDAVDSDSESEDISEDDSARCLTRPEWMKTDWNKSPDVRSFGLVFTGHPGTGKTFFLYVLLAMRCITRRPTWFIDRKKYFYCDENGVEMFPNADAALSKFSETVIDRNVWCLLNSDVQVGSADDLALYENRGFLIQPTSPCSFHMDWIKRSSPQNLVQKIFLQPPTLDEFIAIAEISCPHLKCSDVLEFYQKFGPSLRTGLSFVGEALIEWERNLIESIETSKWGELFTLLHDPSKVMKDSVSHHIVLVIAQPGSRTRCMGVLATEYIKELVDKHTSLSWELQVNTVYQNFLAHPYTRVPAGLMLDAGLHRLFSKPGVWELLRLVKSKSKPDVNQLWTVMDSSDPSASAFFTVGGLGEPAQISNDQPAVPPIRNLTVYMYSTLAKLDLTGHSGYYRPTMANHPSFDAFIYTSETRTAYALQATVSSGHSVSATGLHWLKGLPGVDKVIYIIVTSEYSVDLPFPLSAKYRHIDQDGKQRMVKKAIDTNELVAERYHCQVINLAKTTGEIYGNINELKRSRPDDHNANLPPALR